MKFGTSGLRGLSSDLIGPSSAQYTEAFLIHLLETGQSKKGDRVFVGSDLRASSPTIVDRCVSAIQKQGFVPVECGQLPTPALALSAIEVGCAALMVTGSHIPEDRNGIKFYRPDGEIDKQDETSIIAIADRIADRYEAPPTINLKVENAFSTVYGTYLERCQKILQVDALSGLVIGIYEHSSIARDALIEVLEFYGATVVRFDRSEKFIAVDTESVEPATMAKLRAWASQQKLDAIVSADGDGDRPLVADEKGDVLRGDLLGLMSAELINAEVIVTPITSNSGIAGTDTTKVVRTKVGSPYVIEAMKSSSSTAVTIGFEANGGVLLGSNADVPGGLLEALPTRDCVLPILAALETSRRLQRPLSKLSQAYRFPTAVADRIKDVPQKASEALAENLQANPDAFFEDIGKVDGLDTTDGLRFTLSGSEIVHFRPSGNAPELRCYCEAGSEKRAQQLLELAIGKARQFAKAAA